MRLLATIVDATGAPLRITTSAVRGQLWFVTDDEEGNSLPVGCFDEAALADIRSVLNDWLSV